MTRYRSKLLQFLSTTAYSGMALSGLFVTQGIVLIPVSAYAQEASSSQVSEVTVTARRREERLEDVPLAITALGATELRTAGVIDLRDITFLTPGLQLASSGADAREHPVIRGQTDIGFNVNNVSVFLDGIYISDASSIDLGLIDLERIEIVKGPVSALYGRSSYAGAINYVTAKPTDHPKGSLDFTAGDYGRESLRASVSGPIVEGVLRGGISGSYDTFDGTYHDKTTNQDAGGDERKDVLINLEWTPNSHIMVRPVLYYGNDFFNDTPTKTGPANCGAAPLTTGFNYARSYCGRVDPDNFTGPFIAAPGDLGTVGNQRFVLSTSLQAAARYDWGTVSSLTGYNNIGSTQYAEFDNIYGVPAATYYLPAGAAPYTFPASAASVGALPTGQTALAPVHFGYQNREQDFSEEIRYASRQDYPVRFSFGAYIAKSDNFQDVQIAVSSENVPAGQYLISAFATSPGEKYSTQHAQTIQHNTIDAGFLSGDWDIIKDLTVSTELRYTSQKSVFEEHYTPFVPYGVGYSIGVPSKFDPIGGPEEHTYDSLTSRSTLRYKFATNLMGYVSAANGEKVGGFNATTILANQSYNPETNWTYEVGVKSAWFNSRLQFDADIYHIDASSYQVTAPSSTTGPSVYITRNFGSLSTTGVEVSAVIKPIDGITITPGVSYADPKFQSDAFDFSSQDIAVCRSLPTCVSRVTKYGVAPAIALKGLRPPNESNLLFNIALEARHRLYQDWNGFARLDYRYESKQYYSYPIDSGSFGPLNNVNLRAGVERDRLRISVWVKNLTNDNTPVGIVDSGSTGAVASYYQSGYYPVLSMPEKRTFGATLNYKY